MKRVGIGVAAFLLGAMLALSLPSLAQDPGGEGETDEPDRTVTVSGSATIRSAPDEAVVWLGVQTHAQTAESAMRDNADRMNAVLDRLRDLGIGNNDLATSGISLWPAYDAAGQIDGYQAQNQVEVTVRYLDKVGRAIDVAVAAGANLTNGITFRLSDENEGRDEALVDAVADARGKAELLAAAAGAELGPVVTISEASAPVYPPVYFEDAVAAEAGVAAPTPIRPPTLESLVTVTVVWSIA
jgi:hypothetical protein